jgi:hypothetical protein
VPVELFYPTCLRWLLARLLGAIRKKRCACAYVCVYYILTCKVTCLLACLLRRMPIKLSDGRVLPTWLVEMLTSAAQAESGISVGGLLPSILRGYFGGI